MPREFSIDVQVTKNDQTLFQSKFRSTCREIWLFELRKRISYSLFLRPGVDQIVYDSYIIPDLPASFRGVGFASLMARYMEAIYGGSLFADATVGVFCKLPRNWRDANFRQDILQHIPNVQMSEEFRQTDRWCKFTSVGLDALLAAWWLVAHIRCICMHQSDYTPETVIQLFKDTPKEVWYNNGDGASSALALTELQQNGLHPDHAAKMIYTTSYYAPSSSIGFFTLDRDELNLLRKALSSYIREEETC